MPHAGKLAAVVHLGLGPREVIDAMSTYRLSNVLAPRSVALVGASPRPGSLGAAILQQHPQRRICRRDRHRQSALWRDRRHDGCQPHRQAAVRARARRRHGAGAGNSRHRRRRRQARCCRCGHRQRRPRPWPGLDRGSHRTRGAGASHAPDRPELPRHHDAAHQAQCELCRAYAARRQSCADLAVRRDRGRHGGLGRAEIRRLLRHRLDRRPARRRYRRSARLFCARPRYRRDPALYRGGPRRPKIHVGGARRRARQADRGGQIGPDGARRPRRGDPHRRARRRRRRLRRRVPPRRHAAGVRPARIVRLRRDARPASQRRSGKRLAHADQWRRPRRAGGGPAGRAWRRHRGACRPRPNSSSMPCCRRPGRERIRSTSSAMPMPRAMRRRWRFCWPIPTTMRCWS